VRHYQSLVSRICNSRPTSEWPLRQAKCIGVFSSLLTASTFYDAHREVTCEPGHLSAHNESYCASFD
jgi:hypothetical protein